jgi:hypothetical protein
MHSFKCDLKDKVFGCRLNLIKQDFEEFLSTLVKNGAELLFVFKKSQTLENDFSGKVEYEYLGSIEFLDVMETLKTLSGVLDHYETRMLINYPANMQILLVLMQTAKKFGQIVGFDSAIDCKPSTAHVKLANEKNAFAIIGHDTYYIFYKGSWKFWSDVDLDMKTMITREYDKEKIMKNLQLTTERIPLFIALAGGVYTSFQNVKTMANFFKHWEPNYLLRVSSFVNQQKFPLKKDSITKIVSTIFKRHDLSLIAEIQRTFELMDPEKEFKYPNEFHEDILKASENELLNYANEILLEKPIFFSPNFTDLR